MTHSAISETDSYKRHRVSVLDSEMAYIDTGAILTGSPRDFCRAWSNQHEVTVKGIHFIQEDSPNNIGQAISAFLNP